ncbi:MAG: TolC family protein [Elusimicrobia bacterium]|nr:TolC family protein [Elusimicrobiota bacterium]
MRINRTVLLWCLLFATAASAAPVNMAWDDIVKQARLYNPLLKKADQSLRQAELSYRQSMGGFLPQLSANAGTGQSASDSNGFSRSASYGFSGSMSLFSGFSDLSALRISDCDRMIAAAAHQRVFADVLYDLRAGYINLVWAQEYVKVAGDILKRRTENAAMIELKYDAGAEDKGALLRVQGDKLRATFELAQARRKAITAQRQLARLIGRDDIDEISALGTLDPGALAAESFSKDQVATLPEFRIASYTADKAALGVTAARSGLYPNLTVSGSTGKTGSDWMPDSNQWSAGLNLSFPFFTGGKNIYAARIAAVAKTMAEATFQAAARDLEIKLSRSHDGLMDAFENVAVQNMQTHAAAEQESITTAKYINGLASYQDWYVIENDYVAGQKALLNAQRDASLVLAQWDNDLGSGELK